LLLSLFFVGLFLNIFFVIYFACRRWALSLTNIFNQFLFAHFRLGFRILNHLRFFLLRRLGIFAGCIGRLVFFIGVICLTGGRFMYSVVIIVSGLLWIYLILDLGNR